VSMSLQYGVPLEDYVRKFSHMRFEPQGYTKNPDIRIAKSLIDYIFRWLGITFLPGYKEATLGAVEKPSGFGPQGSGASDASSEAKPVDKKSDGPTMAKEGKPAGETNGHHTERAGTSSSPVNGHSNGVSAKLLQRAGAAFDDLNEGGDRNEQFASFQSDAPACDGCGAITVRNGNCYLCHNCGNSMGCS
jgi:ribonucleoside-diphosphate reductase alpha chain